MRDQYFQQPKGKPDIIVTGYPEDLPQQIYKHTPPGAGGPRRIFDTSLEIGREIEDKLAQHCAKELARLKADLGFCDVGAYHEYIRPTNQSGGGREWSFFGKRAVYAEMAENRYDWRPACVGGPNIYTTSNLAVPICRRVAVQSAARAMNYFFGSDPWLGLSAVGASDDETANNLQKLAEHKLSLAGNQDTLRRSFDTAFTLGECVLKITHTARSTYYRTKTIVLVDQPGGTMIGDASGNHIDQQEPWVAGETGGMVLKRDGVTPMPAVPVWEERLVEQEISHYKGPLMQQVYYRDFLCGVNDQSIQEAPTCVQLLTLEAADLVQAYFDHPGRNLESLRQCLEALALARAGQSSTPSERRPEMDVGDGTAAPPGRRLNVGEFYTRFDADGDGYAEDLIVLMDVDSNLPLYYDYVANATHDGLRPFRIITADPVLNRWYGQGAYEYFYAQQEFIDLTVNRRNICQGAAGRVTLWNAAATREGQANPNLKMNFGNTYTLASGYSKADDVVKVVYLDDNKYDALTAEVEFWMQVVLNESGVAHANDSGLVGSDTTKLATGIKNIEKSSQERFAVAISELETRLSGALDCFLGVMVKHMDEEETVTVLEDDAAAQSVLVHKHAVSNLELHVKLLLTRYEAEQEYAGMSEALPFIKDWYALPPEMRQILLPAYLQILKTLQVRNPERYFDIAIIPTMPTPTPGGEGPSTRAKSSPPLL